MSPTTHDLRIRPETPDDHERVHAVIAAAFGQDGEALLVDRLRGKAEPEISLVALTPEQELVGHIFFSRVLVGAMQRPAIALAPLSVDPAHQGRSLGSALCRRGLDECRALGELVVFVLGHPAYYPRFGFEPAAPHGLYFRDESFAPAFFVAELDPGALMGFEGEVRYRPEFDDV